MDTLIIVIGLVGSFLLLCGAVLAAAYAYRVAGEGDKPAALFWSGGAALLVTLVFARSFPLCLLVFTLSTSGIFCAVVLIDFLVQQRVRARRRDTFLRGRNM